MGKSLVKLAFKGIKGFLFSVKPQIADLNEAGEKKDEYPFFKFRPASSRKKIKLNKKNQLEKQWN